VSMAGAYSGSMASGPLRRAMLGGPNPIRLPRGPSASKRGHGQAPILLENFKGAAFRENKILTRFDDGC
jgi:hypothetical protein